MLNLYSFVLDQVEYHDVIEGKLAALNKNVKLNIYYTPTKLTENSLVFNKKLMTEWWKQGYDYAATKVKEDKENAKKTKVELWWKLDFNSE